MASRFKLIYEENDHTFKLTEWPDGMKKKSAGIILAVYDADDLINILLALLRP